MRSIFLVTLALAHGVAFGASAPDETKLVGMESHERNVDRAALQAQDKSIASLVLVFKKYRGNPSQEPAFLSRLGDLQVQRASLLFRLSRGIANAEYKKGLEQAVATYSELIKKYPDCAEIPIALFSRAKAYSELKRDPLAKIDYERLIAAYPDFEYIDAAHMAVADIDMEANNYISAVKHLHEVEKNTESGHYPYALTKLGWSYYNLKDFKKATDYAEKHIRYHQALKAEDDADAQLIATSIENSMSDFALFWFDAFEAKADGFTVAKAIDRIHDLDSKTFFGKTFLRFAKLLKAHGQYEAMLEVKKITMSEYASVPETTDAVLLVFDYEFDKRDFKNIKNTAKDILVMNRKASKEQKFAIERKLVETTKELQDMVLKNKKSTEVVTLSVPLAELYGTFIEVVGDSDPRVAMARYNLAETQFEIKEFAKATLNYRWVIENASRKQIEKGGLVKETIALKAIASRYEELDAKGDLAKTIEVVAYTKDKGAEVDRASLIGQWITWIDAYKKDFGQTAKLESETFEFEANRALYVQGYVRVAIERMIRFSIEKPKSKHAVGAAGLALDTYVKSEDWEKTHDLAEKLLKVEVWKTSEFYTKTKEIAADSWFKLADVKGDATVEQRKLSLSRAEECTVKYADSKRYVDCLVLAGRVSMDLHDFKRAEGWFTKILADPKSDLHVNATLLLRAQIREEQMRFGESVADLETYLKRTEWKDADIKKKVTKFAWISGEAKLLAHVLETKEFCHEGNRDECERYSAVLALKSPTDDEKAKVYYDKAYKGLSEVKAVWALAALKSPKKFQFADRMVLLQRAADQWKKLDAETQFAVFPDLRRIVTDALEFNRMAIGTVAPLKADAHSIERRVMLTKDFESSVSRITKMNFGALRVVALASLADVYGDFVSSLSTLPMPKTITPEEKAAYDDVIAKLSAPFTQKTIDIRKAALDLGSKIAVDAEVWAPVADKYFNDVPAARDLAQYSIPRIDSPKYDDMLLAKELQTEDAKAFMKIWRQAIERGNHALAFHMSLEADTRWKLGKKEALLFKALSFELAGAKSEAVELIQDELADASTDLGRRAAKFVLGRAVAVSSIDRSKDALSALVKGDDRLSFIDSNEDALAVAAAAEICGYNFSEDEKVKLFKKARRSDAQLGARWASEKLKEIEQRREIASQKAGGKSS